MIGVLPKAVITGLANLKATLLPGATPEAPESHGKNTGFATQHKWYTLGSLANTLQERSASKVSHKSRNSGLAAAPGEPDLSAEQLAHVIACSDWDRAKRGRLLDDVLSLRTQDGLGVSDLGYLDSGAKYLVDWVTKNFAGKSLAEARQTPDANQPSKTEQTGQAPSTVVPPIPDLGANITTLAREGWTTKSTTSAQEYLGASWQGEETKAEYGQGPDKTELNMAKFTVGDVDGLKVTAKFGKMAGPSESDDKRTVYGAIVEAKGYDGSRHRVSFSYEGNVPKSKPGSPTLPR